MGKLFLFAFMLLSTNIKAETTKSENRYLNRSTICSVVSQQDTTLTYLTTLSLTSFINKPVDSLLAILPINYTNRVIHGMGNLKYAKVLSVRYAGNIRVLIFVKNFVYMNPRSEIGQWDINLFKLENISCIEIWDNNSKVSSGSCEDFY
ncbi:MAG: hypothetical protein IPH18_12905 [Chitinophagaceae bacterium]|nr:hypothetical protein [Chitinophagaceae bacterium]MBK8951413.1 hypothetical protein [Chitinophagaceae bacterium]